MQYVLNDKNLPTFYSPTEKTSSISVGQTPALSATPITALHYHNHAEFGICVDGEGETYVENRIYKYKKGCIQILPPRVSHLSKSKLGYRSNWIWINVNPIKLFSELGITDPDGIISLANNDNFLCGVYEENEYPELTNALNNIVKEYNDKSEDKNLALAITVSSLILFCKRIKRKSARDNLIGNAKNYYNEIQPAIDFISSNLDNNKGLSENSLAKLLNVSVSTLRRYFKQSTGMNPKEFIIHSRMAYAEYLLRKTNYSVLEISLKVGYNEISGFNRTFKEFFKLSPAKYRKYNK